MHRVSFLYNYSQWTWYWTWSGMLCWACIWKYWSSKFSSMTVSLCCLENCILWEKLFCLTLCMSSLHHVISFFLSRIDVLCARACWRCKAQRCSTRAEAHPEQRCHWKPTSRRLPANSDLLMDLVHLLRGRNRHAPNKWKTSIAWQVTKSNWAGVPQNS